MQQTNMYKHIGDVSPNLISSMRIINKNRTYWCGTMQSNHLVMLVGQMDTVVEKYNRLEDRNGRYKPFYRKAAEFFSIGKCFENTVESWGLFSVHSIGLYCFKQVFVVHDTIAVDIRSSDNFCNFIPGDTQLIFYITSEKEKLLGIYSKSHK